MKLLRALLAALSFLTRLPVGRSLVLAPEELGRALYFFPLVGAALGAALWLVERALRGHLSAELLAIALTAVLAALTGGLHLDGVADVCDGLAGGRGDRERALAIMHDSRIGALGALALVLLLFAKVIALRDALELAPRHSAQLLIAFPAIARAAVVPLIALIPYARAEGLGAAFHAHAGMRHVLLAMLAVLAVAAIAFASSIAPRMLVAIGAALALATAFGLCLRRRLGGLTGDAYGAAIELAELAFLVACAVRV